MRILAIISGMYGRRNVENIRATGPEEWNVEVWKSPAFFPPVIDEPEEFLPDSFLPADLILSFAEDKGVAELLPDIAKMTGAKAVVVAVDNETWLPLGLARQLRGWLDEIGVACATPRPLCSLTSHDYGLTRNRKDRVEFESPEIAEFTRYFGKPELEIEIDPDERIINSITVTRDAVCGNTRHVAKEIIGVSVDDVETATGLIHHHFPCMASMTKLDDFNHDTLMHESGNILKDNITRQIKPYKRTFTPGKLSA
ncbi:MAG: hypothetical protein DRI56_08515 [Chloroflexota bacterium]|nr:MAG: hypothetical protein B6243_03845 [Anaerolineaceae bacterium 4572_5.2]RLD06152.1 MAG: hypothetical protein DRI56_08515 [Chloroflexota bacterium]